MSSTYISMSNTRRTLYGCNNCPACLLSAQSNELNDCENAQRFQKDLNLICQKFYCRKLQELIKKLERHCHTLLVGMDHVFRFNFFNLKFKLFPDHELRLYTPHGGNAVMIIQIGVSITFHTLSATIGWRFVKRKTYSKTVKSLHKQSAFLWVT